MRGGSFLVVVGQLTFCCALGWQTDALTAADLVNSYSASQLADLLFHLGNEKHSRREL